MPVNISTQVDGTVATLKLQGKFVFSDHRDFRQAVKAQLEGHCTVLELDFGGVDYLDSAALGMLSLAREGASATGKTIVLVNCQGTVKQVLAIANFHKLFTMR